jgi:alpha-tubulin suppressor-like RCC1 family protein
MRQAIFYPTAAARHLAQRTALLVRLSFALALGALSAPAMASQPLLNAQHLAAGGGHVCAIVNGGAQCWGDNINGELGNGTFLDSALPTPVLGLGSGVTALAMGGYHTCAIVNGGVQCWGYNFDGELGNGSTDDSEFPVPVQGLSSGVVAIGAGAYHTCAVTSAGAVRCWGYNSNGELGDNTTNATGAGAPSSVSGLTSGATLIAGGAYHTCALVSGGVQCWGYNFDGELDNGTVNDSHVPVTAGGLTSGVSALSAGLYHTCAIVTGGALRCWGWNSNGQLGNNTITATGTGAPVAVSGVTSGVSALAAGGDHTCAVVSGAAKCWGENSWGQLGVGSLVDSHVPVAVSGLSSGVTAIAADFVHSCAQVTVSGASQTRCWGGNVDGEVGLGDAIYETSPVAVVTITSGATSLSSSATAQHTCAVVSGAAKCWGNNENGELGNGSTLDSSTPVAVSGLTSGVTAIANGAFHSCAVVSGKAECWGANFDGQLGNGTTTDSGTPVTVISSGVTAVAAGYGHSCAIVSQAVKCWGNNVNGELGDGSIMQSNTPVAVTGLSGHALAIAVGVAHTCVVIQGGTVQCWGYNSNGQLGNNTTTSTATNPPVTVMNISSGATAIAAGGYHSCAIVSGAAQCWGDGLVGQLGDGLSADSLVPVAVTGITSGFTAIAGGNGQTCAVASGAAYCWGSGYYGALGNGSTLIHTSPFAVTGLSANVTAVGTGNTQSCAIVSGAIKCWGTDYYGELGNARSIFVEAPEGVVIGDEIFSGGFEQN